MKKNYYSLLGMRILKKTITIFTDSFLVLYFLQLSNNNIIPLGIYNLFQYTITFLVIFSLRNLIKKKNRIILLRLGIIFNFIFFLLILFLKTKLIQYIWLVGIVYGLEEGLYFSVFNIYESKISKEKLAKYSGTYTWVNSVISVIIPLVFGSIMSFRGFGRCTLVVLVLVLIKIVFSLLYKDKIIPKEEKIDLKSYFPLIKKNKNLFTSYMWNFTNGLTYSGAFSSLITIYIIKQFQTGFSLGIITSILSIVTSIASFLFANFIKNKSYKKILCASYITTIISLLLMVLKCNTITIIIFNFIQSFAKTYANLIDWNNCLIVSNIYKEKKEEFFVTNEIFIFVGRFISYLVFCLLAFANTSLKTNIVMMIFILFLLLRSVFSIKLQKITEK